MNVKKCLIALCLSMFLATVAGCAGKEKEEAPVETAEVVATDVAAADASVSATPATLPVRFQAPNYLTPAQQVNDDMESESEEYEIKVGATIRSTGGPQPLWDILKRLANLKNMSVSWASDVNLSALVDVDIAAEDNFFAAIDNLLRQVDYFHVVENKTIIVKYKSTKVYQIALPQIKGNYTTTVGGNYLTDRDAATGTEGTVKITSDENSFDVWENIKLNLDTILEVWSVRRETETGDEGIDDEDSAASNQTENTDKIDTGDDRSKLTQKTVDAKAYYTVDKSIGLISVTAPKPLLEKVDLYITNLKKELYRQVVIEAKIIEVFLQDNSKIGLDWSGVLKDFDISGTTFFGTAGSGGDGQVYPWIPAVGEADSITTFVSKITLSPVNFSVMLNALNEQGDATVLSNPKLTVLNGQPALISVGTDITYIKEVSSETNSETRTVTYTAETDSVVEGVALGVVPSIIDDDSIMLHLTPITTDLVEDPIEYRQIGGEALEIGLPRVRVRDMSTMVRVNNGEMLIIGGLIDSVEAKEGKFAPVVGNIPLFKYLFGYEEKKMEKRELVILLTPKII